GQSCFWSEREKRAIYLNLLPFDSILCHGFRDKENCRIPTSLCTCARGIVRELPWKMKCAADGQFRRQKTVVEDGGFRVPKWRPFMLRRGWMTVLRDGRRAGDRRRSLWRYRPACQRSVNACAVRRSGEIAKRTR